MRAVSGEHREETQPMKEAYSQWIREYLSVNKSVLGRCMDAVGKMREEFPELQEVRGHVYCQWGKRGHVWCKTEDGEIVDPTQSQFPGLVQYEPWEPGMEVRAGKCMNCGTDIWVSVQTLSEKPPCKSSCSEECEQELMAYYNTL
jgi:hypothetical protein